MDPSAVEKSYASAANATPSIGVDTDEGPRPPPDDRPLAPLLAGRRRRRLRKRTPAGSPAAASRSPGAYPGKARTVEELRVRPPTRRSPSSPAATGSTSTPCTASSAAAPSTATRSSPSTSAAGSNGPARTNLKLDFNATCFAHPKAAAGFTLSSKDPGIRKFWIEHVKRCRKIAAYMGRELQAACLHNLWIPDGAKDVPVDRWTARALLKKSLDEIYETEYSPLQMKDCGREQALRHRQRVLRRRLPRILPGLCLHQGQDRLPRPRPLPSDGIRGRQDLGHPPVLRRDPAPRQPWRALGQRPRRPAQRRDPRPWPRRSSAARPSTGSISPSIISTPASTASAPGCSGPGPLLKGLPHRPARAPGKAPGARSGVQDPAAPLPARGAQEPALRPGLGRLLPPERRASRRRLAPRSRRLRAAGAQPPLKTGDSRDLPGRISGAASGRGPSPFPLTRARFCLNWGDGTTIPTKEDRWR